MLPKRKNSSLWEPKNSKHSLRGKAAILYSFDFTPTMQDPNYLNF